MIINKKWMNSAVNCEEYSSFEGKFSDHRTIAVKIYLSPCRKKQPSKPYIMTGPHLSIEI